LPERFLSPLGHKCFNKKRRFFWNRLFFVWGDEELLFVFVSHLFSKLSVFVLGDFLSSLFNNATHSILSSL